MVRLIPELKWFIPFICLAAIASIVIRPEPAAQVPSGTRVVTDARGKSIHLAVPFRGSVLTRGAQVSGYLEATAALDTLLAVTSYHMGDRVRNHIIGNIFPQIVVSPRVWNSAGLSDTQGPKVEIERLLLFAPGVFIGWYTLAEPVERVGLPFVGLKTFPQTQDELDIETRAYSGVVGNRGRGFSILAHEKEAYQQLDNELHQSQEMQRPRYLYLNISASGPGVIGVLGSRNHYTRFFLPHTGVVNGCSCPGFGENVDAEHIILNDPDIIVLGPGPGAELPDAFIHDPRWRGLSAVAKHRVYSAPSGIDYFIAPPFWSRWLAELAHPDRLQPKSRELYREYIEWLLNYRLSDKELDTAFAVKNNHGMVNAERFESLQEPPKKGKTL